MSIYRYIGIGTKLKLNNNKKYQYNTDEPFIVIADVTDSWQLSMPGGGPGYVSKVDVMNWFSIWPGHDDELPTKGETTVTYKYKCQEPGQEHELVNVSFMGMNMRCKYCDIAEKEIPKYASTIQYK